MSKVYTAEDIGVKEVKEFFNMDGAAMLKEWRSLNDEERAFFKAGIADEWNRNGRNTQQ